ncbi:baseplate J/gp47 family protein [Chakrabartyella piscis]|uniref:baseplate J/gp47 family protein n=1 Tax=Chakrabartyella piscis TaxID=2918914 RepID=UPI002958D727|nr:baseplate J/gp47 family protein [Chakrabartyella piscis]
MYESYEELMERKLSLVDDKRDKRQGSLIYDAMAPNAAETATYYAELAFLMDRTFGDTATGDDLTRRCAERGIIRKDATQATIYGELLDADGAIYEAAEGNRFSLEGQYYTLSGMEDGRYVFLSETYGESGNYYLGEILPVQHLEGLATANLTEIRTDGEDAEDDETLRSRYLASFSTTVFGGNVADYTQKLTAMEVVGGVKVYPVWDGGGTVKIVFVDRSYEKPTDTEVEEVQTTLDPEERGLGYGVAPIGHKVHVEGVSEVECTITFDLTLQTDAVEETVVAAIEEALEAYMSEVRATWADKEYLVVRISYLEARILETTGVLDVANCTINGVDGNLTIGADEIPILASVEVTT